MLEQFVPKYYVMDPETEEIVFDGTCLENGMVVLIANPNERARPETDWSRDWSLDRLNECNRWCKVSKVTVFPEINVVHFIGTYEDGTQRKRKYSIDESWIVKKDSMDLAERLPEKVQECIMATVMDAIQVKISKGPSEDEKTTKLCEIVEKSTSRILGLL